MAKLMDDPLCEHCRVADICEPATQVDHVDAIEKGGAAFPPLDGLASLCAGCHSRKTNLVDKPGAGKTLKRVIKGCDASGNPFGGW
ncbi:HNH endonuclease [Rhizobium herbae]|uniref:5-methylcytosine-specific restriction protein A n=1 Tax=Rhizobium herbae TaxID=508661 RepID=A0ABS4EFQ4_9HYPH|nr:HNH endonuclease [Rhizobium herbae]MBP1856775.1 5-methylcytosine-specific restriction protein A [Rhizobium herbae]